MKKEIVKPLTSGALTGKHTDVKAEFKEFQAFLLNRKKTIPADKMLEMEFLAIRLKMEEYLRSENSSPYYVGYFIKEYLTAAKIKQNKFADYVGIKPSNLNSILNGDRPVNYELALILSKIFNVDPRLWIQVQIKNELENLIALKKKKYSRFSIEDLIQIR